MSDDSEGLPVEAGPASDTPYLKIGHVASILGISTARIRLWEDEGLITSSRTDKGHRRYSAQHIELLKRIRDLLNDKTKRYEDVREALRKEPPLATGLPPGQASPTFLSIGERVRNLRKHLGLSRKELARRTSISPSALSALERGLRQPNAGRVSIIAHELGTTMTNLLGVPGPSQDKLVVRADERVQLALTDTGVKIELLYQRMSLLQSQSITVEPNCGVLDPFIHEGEDLVTVISGEVTIILDGADSYRLDTGDSITFPSERPHAFYNSGSTMTHLIWINTPPTF